MAVLDYFKPASLSEAVALLEQYGDEARVLAGGTDIIVNLRDKALQCKYLIDIKAIPEMQELRYSEGEGLVVGGAVTINQLLQAPQVRENYPILIQAGSSLANTLVRNRATFLGNLCNASPAADMAPAALVLGAAVVAVAKTGSRRIPLAEFFSGVKQNVLQRGEIAAKIAIPVSAGRGIYLKKSRIKGHDLAQVGVAGFLGVDGQLRLALGAVAPVPVLVQDLGPVRDGDLRQEERITAIVDQVLARVKPISDQRASREYRLAMVAYLVRQALAFLGKEE
ncbi:FAD binding domain-containing protein [Moorella naiadis]|uniref:FAD binding domain-containing protein n=1 Tax=Moorella naiadis (nom. illeg.) TaxID=3093670 RepID=UPI003D9CB377